MIHGTRTKYLFDKCRCEPCKMAQSEYIRPYLKARRAAGLDPEYNRRREFGDVKSKILKTWRQEQIKRGFDSDFWATIGT